MSYNCVACPKCLKYIGFRPNPPEGKVVMMPLEKQRNKSGDKPKVMRSMKGRECRNGRWVLPKGHRDYERYKAMGKT